MKSEEKVIVITGPTASGKSATAVELAIVLNGEVVCADSMQLYKGMDIGTEKPTEGQQKGIPHHLMDILTPDKSFSVADYKKEATSAIKDILSRGKMPILCGGTGQYISSMIDGTEFTPVKTSEIVRHELYMTLTDKGFDYLYNELIKIDAESAAVLHPHDSKRVMRALEVYYSTGMTKTELNRISKEKGPDFQFLSFCINHDREILYERINHRVDSMIEEGLINEISQLLKEYPVLSNTAYQAIGYKEFIPYLEGQSTLYAAMEKVKQATRNYAKRQMTWFRKIESLNWIHNQVTSMAVETIMKKFNEEN